MTYHHYIHLCHFIRIPLYNTVNMYMIVYVLSTISIYIHLILIVYVLQKYILSSLEKPHGKSLKSRVYPHFISSKRWFRMVIFLAISCPYSRAEHIPCQNSWEISGNCEDPFQVKFVFRTVCQVLLFFWHVGCRLHMFFPKEDPYFQQFLEMS